MKTIYNATCAVSMILLLVACSKKEIYSPAPDSGDTAVNLLDSIVWTDLQETTYFKYRTDSTPDKIFYGFPVVKDTVSFSYTGNRVSQITSSRSRRASDYRYNAVGKITDITIHPASGSGTSYILEFSYNGAGRPILLDYFLKNEAGKHLQYHSLYNYNAAGLLEKITQQTPGGIIITHVIEAWSDKCNFNPWAFIDPVTITETMTIYNLPVLQTMDKLPVKVTTTFTGSVESVKRREFIIQNERIDKMLALWEYPGSPSFNYQTRVNFFYHP
ncbi:MAG: hypothetical protein H7Y86_15145 [Rhizobacter sp.]|nr:hypothetical protein [Ferruginibacter sp.]